jgi:hypothetical protein
MAIEKYANMQPESFSISRNVEKALQAFYWGNRYVHRDPTTKAASE